jgi:hypothetical protein
MEKSKLVANDRKTQKQNRLLPSIAKKSKPKSNPAGTIKKSNPKIESCGQSPTITASLPLANMISEGFNCSKPAKRTAAVAIEGV